MMPDSYRISMNPSTQSSFYTNMTTAILEGQYNTQLKVSLKAINCAGIQAVSCQVFIGEYIYLCLPAVMLIIIEQRIVIHMTNI